MTQLGVPLNIPTFTALQITPVVQQRIQENHLHLHVQLPPQAPANYGQQAYWVPPPRPELSSPPAGRGVTGAPKDEGWPEPSYRTAGGYTIVFDGHSESMKVYGPDQQPGDKPLANVWGDPHVAESDGTKWDFTEDGDMILPDGTMLAMDTTANTGRSLLEKVDIINGSDHVSVSGISKNQPKAGLVRADGFAWRADHIARFAGTDHRSFVLGTRDDEDVTFNLFVGGVDQGEITSGKWENNKYTQVTDGGHLYQPDPSLIPPLGSAAWGNAVRSTLLDTMVSQDPTLAQAYGAYFSADHDAAAHPWGRGASNTLFGGLVGEYQNFPAANQALADMGNLILLQGQSNAGLAAANPQFAIGAPSIRGGAPGGALLPSSGLPAPAGNHVINNSNISREQAHQVEIDRVLSDPSLSVEDKVMLSLMLIMKKMDKDIEGQAQYINRAQNQGAQREGATAGGHDLTQGPGVAGQGSGAATDSPSIDIETAKLERMVKKRGHMFEMLRGLISKYDETAKNVNQSIGR